MSGHDRMLRALNNSIYSRPRGLWERLVFPMLRVAYKQGFEDGYGTGYVTGERNAEAGDVS